MKKKIIIFLFILSSFLYASLNLGAQSSRNLQTEVFVMRTSELKTDSSFYKIVSKVGGKRKHTYSRKLEMPSRKLSALRIEDINPLRFYYFINNQLVTQFMEPTPTLFGLNTTNQGNQLTPTNINFLRLFNNQKNQNDSASDTLSRLDKKIGILKDSLEYTLSQFSKARTEYFNLEYSLKDTSLKNKKISAKDEEKIKLLKDKAKTTGESFSDKYTQLQNAISLYEDLIDQKIFNVTRSGILNNFKEYYDGNTFAIRVFDLDSTSDVVSQMRSISHFESTLNALIQNRTQILDTLTSLENNAQFNTIQNKRNLLNLNRHLFTGYNSSEFSNQIDSLSHLLQNNFGISLNVKKLNQSTTQIEDLQIDENRLMEIFRIKKLVSAFILDFCEQFVLKTTVDVGKLLQVQVFQLSGFENDIRNKKFIDKSTIDSITRIRDITQNTFTFIQNISTDLSVFANAIKTNGESFQPYLKNIDSNYITILDYLKVFDFVNKNNLVEYTLPRSSNSSNADFVRYTVSRLDKNTLSSEDLTYDIWLKGGIKIDFSAGFFASGLVDNQYQKLFISHDSLTNNDSIQIHRIKDGKYAFGFGGMVNLTIRTGASWVAPGISLGFIYSNNQKLQIILGGSLHLGKTERIIFHAGMAAGTVKTFDDSPLKYPSNSIKKNENWGFKVDDYNSYTVPSLIDKFSIRPFFGMSYNLSKNGPHNAVSEPGLSKYNSLLVNPRISSASGSSNQ